VIDKVFTLTANC